MRHRFVIIGRPRVGSTLLLTLLRSHPDVYCHREIFNPRRFLAKHHEEVRRVGAIGFIHQCFDRAGTRVNGIKLMYSHCRRVEYGIDDLPEVWNYLLSDKSIRIIHIKRRNILRSVLSSAIGALENRYAIFRESERNDDITVELDHDTCAAAFSRVSENWRVHDHLFAEHPKIDVFYTDLATCRDEETHRILKFLQVPVQPLNTTLVRQNPRKASDIIRNFDELAEQFAGTEWAWFFKE